MPVDLIEVNSQLAERNKQLEKRYKAKKEREEEQRKKELEEAQKDKEEKESHSERFWLIQRLKLIEVLPGGALDSGMINLLLGELFDKIRDLEVEIKELKTQLGFAKEIKKDIKALEVKINGKEIDSLIETIEKTPG